MTNNLMITS